MKVYRVTMQEGWLDDEEPSRPEYRFREVITLIDIPSKDSPQMLYIWETLEEAYQDAADWDEVYRITSPQSAYVQFRHRDARSKILSIYTSFVN